VCYEPHVLRLTGFGAALALALVLAGGSAAVRAAGGSGSFLGEWTPDAKSNAQLAGHAFQIAGADETSARNAASSFTPSFDDYCSSGATYYILSYTWSPAGTMGGCISDKTKGHVYLWGSHDDVAYVHPVSLPSEDVLSGGWGLADQSNNVAYKKIRAHHPAVRFLAKVKYSTLTKGKHVAEVTTLTGLGELHVLGTLPNCTGSDILSGLGKLQVSVVKVGGPSLVELDKLTLAVTPSSGTYESCDTQSVLQQLRVVVEKSDPAEKDRCKVGSGGTLSIVDRSAKFGGDVAQLHVPACRLSSTYAQAKARKGSKVAVAVTFDENGY
jgi:hypothetical protein